MAKRAGSPLAEQPSAKRSVPADAAREGQSERAIAESSSQAEARHDAEADAPPASPASEVRLRATKFDGESVPLCAAPEDTLASLKADLSSKLNLDRGVSVKLLVGHQVLDDDSMLVKDLPGDDLRLVLTRVPVVLISTGLAGRAKYRAGGVLVPTGHIFFAPCDASRVLRVDPHSMVADCVGPKLSGTDKYEASGVLGADGCAYYAPRDAAKVLQVDSRNAEVCHVGPDMEGEDKYLAGGVLAPNGCIYFAPACAKRVLRIRPGARPGDVAVEEVGPDLEGASKYMAGGVLGIDGRIYFAPCNASRVLCIDPAVDGDRVFEIGPVLPSSPGNDLLGRYVARGVSGSNGCIYFVPGCAGCALRVDPEKQEVATVGPRIQRTCAYEADGLLGPDGRIYFAPFAEDHVLQIDPRAPLGQEVHLMESTPSEWNYMSIKNYMGRGEVAADGCLYFAPGRSSADQVLRIDPDAQKVELFGRHLGKACRQHARYQSGFVRARDGRLFCAPYDSEKVLCLQV